MGGGRKANGQRVGKDSEGAAAGSGMERRARSIREVGFIRVPYSQMVFSLNDV